MKKLSAFLAILLTVSPLLTSAQTTVTMVESGKEVNSQALTNALAGMEDLKSGIDVITRELFELDEIERAKNQNLDERYRLARSEIVRVISSIEEATTSISTAIKKLATYQNQMKATMDQLENTRQSSSSAKVYLEEYINLLYKMELEIYDQQGDNIDEVRLLLTSDNVNKTLVGKEITEAMTIQLTNLIQQADEDESKKIELLAQL